MLLLILHKLHTALTVSSLISVQWAQLQLIKRARTFRAMNSKVKVFSIVGTDIFPEVHSFVFETMKVW